MSVKELGKIIEARVYTEYRGILTSYITVLIAIDFDDGGTQGFGGLWLIDDKTAKSYSDAICKVFKVESLSHLVGMKCYALRNFSTHNSEIVGLETLDGKRFTRYAWRKKMFPEHTKHPLADKIHSLTSELESLKKRIQEKELAIANLSESFVDWE